MNQIHSSTDTIDFRSRENTVSSDETRRERIQVALWSAIELSPRKLAPRAKKEKATTPRFSSKRTIKKGPPVKDLFAKLFRGKSSSQKAGSEWQSAQTIQPTSPLSASNAPQIPTITTEEAKKNIETLYEEFASIIEKCTLSLSDKMKRIATYVGGLRVIFSANVCHGDLKPENILWDDTRFAISDFNGSISITDVCEMMREEYRFTSEAQKLAVKRIVIQLSDASEPKIGKNNDAVRLLVAWDILTEDALQSCTTMSIKNKKKLLDLKHYLATQFIPQNTKGYACTLYFNKMCDFFWRCEKDQFRRACNAFDMRAAALTIYAILTGNPPPLIETDGHYYERLETSLEELGLSKKASTIIRMMAEPQESDPFTLPVSLDALQELQHEFCPEQTQEDEERIKVQRNLEELKIDQELPYSKTELELLQERLAKLQLTKNNLEKHSEGHEESQIHKLKGDLIAKLTNDSEMDKTTREMLVKKAHALDGPQRSSSNEIEELKQARKQLINTHPENPEEEIDHDRRRICIKTAFKAYPQSCQITVGKDIAVLLLDPNELEACDVLIKQEAIGDGASATAYKALSLRTLRHVILKDFQDCVVPQEVQNGGKILSEIGAHVGVQESVKIYCLGAEEGYKRVFLEPYYKNRDYAPSVFADLFCSSWNIPKEKEAVLDVLRESFPTPCNTEQLGDFMNEYGRIFTGVLGIKKFTTLMDSYRMHIA